MFFRIGGFVQLFRRRDSASLGCLGYWSSFTASQARLSYRHHFLHNEPLFLEQMQYCVFPPFLNLCRPSYPNLDSLNEQNGESCMMRATDRTFYFCGGPCTMVHHYAQSCAWTECAFVIEVCLHFWRRK